MIAKRVRRASVCAGAPENVYCSIESEIDT